MPNSNSNKSKENSFSSKIKDLHIELKDYTFFHRPTGINQEDKRFIGRKNVIEKLKAIITNSEVESGAYLITGFRGMGKTSVVNKVLRDLKGGYSETPKLSRYLRIFFIVIIFSFFDVQGLIKFDSDFSIDIYSSIVTGEELFSRFFLIWIPFLLLILSIIVIVLYSKSSANFKGDKKPKIKNYHWKKFVVPFANIFLFQKEKTTASNLIKIFAQDYFAASLIHLFALGIIVYHLTYFGILQINDIDTLKYYQKFICYIISGIVIFYILDWLSKLYLLLKDKGNYFHKPESQKKFNAKKFFLLFFLFCIFFTFFLCQQSVQFF